MDLIDSETIEIIEMAELYIEYGLPPIAGGQLDQAKSFIDAARYANNEKLFWKNKMGVIDG